jgi:hypothetical protein
MRRFLKQVQRRPAFAFDLLHGAGAWTFLGPPTKKCGAMPETTSGEMIELNFDDQPRIERLPFR